MRGGQLKKRSPLMRKYFDSNVEAVTWAMRLQKDGWFTIINSLGPDGSWFVDTYLVEEETEPEWTEAPA